MSAHKYIGISSAGNRIQRIDLMFLDALSHCTGPVTTDALIELADPRNLARLTTNEAIRQLSFLVADGYVERSTSSAEGLIGWLITNKGNAHLVASDAQDIFNECAQYTPVGRNRRVGDKPRIEEASLAEQLRASHEQLDSAGFPRVSVCNAQDPQHPASALLCIDEDELDEWWANLDVEAKADAFAQWSLGNHGRSSHVHIGEPRIPLAGVVVDLSRETTEALRHVARKAAAGGAQ